MTRKPYRLHCIVPGCTRTHGMDVKPDGAFEIICGKHWRGVPSSTRRRFNLVNRRLRRLMQSAYARSNHPTPEHSWASDPLAEPPAARWLYYVRVDDFVQHLRLARLHKRLWALARIAAIEKAMGL